MLMLLGRKERQVNLQRLINEYAVWHEVSGHSHKTIEWYRYVLPTFARWLEAHGRSIHITEITVGDARAFLQAESQRNMVFMNHSTGIERSGKLSDRTLHGYTRGIRAFWNWLVTEDYLTTNSMLKLKPPKLEKRYKEVLSVAEVERLLNQLNQRTFLGARMYAMIALLYDSGLRAGELVGLDLGDVHWGVYQVRVLGKGKKERFVPFSAATSRALRMRAERRNDHGASLCPARRAAPLGSSASTPITSASTAAATSSGRYGRSPTRTTPRRRHTGRRAAIRELR